MLDRFHEKDLGRRILLRENPEQDLGGLLIAIRHTFQQVLYFLASHQDLLQSEPVADARWRLDWGTLAYRPTFCK